MDRLWAGWRSEYVRGVGSAEEQECLFCRLPDEEDAAGLVVERGERAFMALNRFPYTTGHLMVSQYRHVAGLGDLTDDEREDVWRLLVRGVDACRLALAADGCNVGANLGRVAGAGVPGHLHLHVVPRWSGDTNFMTTVGETRVLPEDLADTWARVRAALGGPV